MTRTRFAQEMRRLDTEAGRIAHALNQAQRASWLRAQIGGFAKE